MINYDYICKNCGHELKDVLQSIKDDPLTLCEECGEHSLSRVIFGGRAAFVENVSTIGQLADKNTKNMGHYKRSEIETKVKENKAKSQPSEKDIYGKHATASRTEINKMSAKQKQNYIMRGKK
jgi:putative FmdB family regulatory protein